ncbi:hypothetical protein PVK06_031071 [Gossypium arboreum]|uniref:RNase H type-1 domain-containing protein n=1 Tax=Gossypium arboreum TaxID=29729 RepID=A0ABR0NR24_GOSAR|nr:hypothetical protein PVK06_031071 [Gossypium arboreum]
MMRKQEVAFGWDVALWATPKWVAPPPLIRDCNVAKGFGGSEKLVSTGVILIRDNEGRNLGACCHTNKYIPNAFVAEALAGVQALQFAANLGFTYVILEGDARSVLSRLAVGGDDRSDVRSYPRRKVIDEFASFM